MFDKRYRDLAELLIRYSCRLQAGENLLIEQRGDADALTRELVEAAYRAGGRPLLRCWPEQAERAWRKGADRDTLKLAAQADAALMKKMHAYIGVRQSENIYNLSDISDAANDDYAKYYLDPVHFRVRVPKTRWVVLRHPSPALAQLAAMPGDKFEDFFFRVCCFDYAKLSQAMDPLKRLLDEGDAVEIRGEGVDLRFRIKGVGSVKCDGQCNIPDGEVYTAPLKTSVEGSVTFNAPSAYQGRVFERVHLEFARGRIVNAACAGGAAMQKALETILDTDAGARYIGEFALGLHPHIRRPMRDILFDEKISGSFHFTPGNAYEDAHNGNKSAVHWDLVYLMHPEYGGCEIRLDGELLQKDGRFVRKELQPLNPENFRLPAGRKR